MNNFVLSSHWFNTWKYYVKCLENCDGYYKAFYERLAAKAYMEHLCYLAQEQAK